jgi:hypothetical protein
VTFAILHGLIKEKGFCLVFLEFFFNEEFTHIDEKLQFCFICTEQDQDNFKVQAAA